MNTKTMFEHTCICITGPPHSATRLLLNMLYKHPDVYVPKNILNSVSEFLPLHQFFIQSMDKTPLSSNEYSIYKKDLFLILDAYMENIDKTKPYSVIKMPYYPLNCLEMFVEYFDSNLILLYTNRPIEKIIKSFLRRGEDKLYFNKQHNEIFRQVKKLELHDRIKVLASNSATECFRRITQRCEFLRDQWNKQNPSRKLIIVDVERLVASREYLYDLLDKINISHDCIDDMLSVIDRKRLLRKDYRRIVSRKNMNTIFKHIFSQNMVDSLKKILHR